MPIKTAETWSRRREFFELKEESTGPTKIARHFLVSGRVQGVGFRYFVFRQAKTLGVQGWVRNLFNGDVEAHVQGTAVAVDKMAVLIRKGPSFSFVAECREAPAPLKDYTTFSIER